MYVNDLYGGYCKWKVLCLNKGPAQDVIKRARLTVILNEDGNLRKSLSPIETRDNGMGWVDSECIYDSKPGSQGPIQEESSLFEDTGYNFHRR